MGQFGVGKLYSQIGYDDLANFIGVGRGGPGGGGGQAPNNLRGGGGNIPFATPNNPPTFSFNFYVKQEKITNVPNRSVK